jgi:hypothetical protein
MFATTAPYENISATLDKSYSMVTPTYLVLLYYCVPNYISRFYNQYFEQS